MVFLSSAMAINMTENFSSKCLIISLEHFLKIHDELIVNYMKYASNFMKYNSS